jgi:hypothetical protein
MIRYELYDEYGVRQAHFLKQAETLGTIVIHRLGKFYRPICYDLNSSPHIAKCVPVEVIEFQSEGELVTNAPVQKYRRDHQGSE